jgi:hypothetical protein
MHARVFRLWGQARVLEFLEGGDFSHVKHIAQLDAVLGNLNARIMTNAEVPQRMRRTCVWDQEQSSEHQTSKYAVS